MSALLPLPEGVSSPDICLNFAAVPGWVTQALTLAITAVRVRPSSFLPGDGAFTVSEFADRRFFQLAYSDGTRFLMDDAATRIWGEPGPGLCYEDLCIYLLGPVMGFVLRQVGGTGWLRQINNRGSACASRLARFGRGRVRSCGFGRALSSPSGVSTRLFVARFG